MKILNIIFLTISSFSFLYSSDKTCIYVNSYHEGFVWSDTISKHIKANLKDTCKIIEFYMDSKRNKSPEEIGKKALEAKKLIDDIQPDLVITSDDNAAKYLIKPYFKDSDIPFVFCGVNWTVKEYGFPYSNVTGMIEIIPIPEIIKLAVNITNKNKGLFLGDNTITDKKDLARFLKYANSHNIELDSSLVNTAKEWKTKYLNAQDKYDFILLGHNSAIKDWNHEEIKEFQAKYSKKLVLSTYGWMMPYSMLGLIIKAEEQGIWAGQTAKAILEGFLIKNISITTNKTWHNYLNMELVKKSNIILSRKLILKSKKYEEE